MALKMLFVKSFSKSDMEYLKKSLSDLYDFIVPGDYEKRTLIGLAGDADVIFGYNIFKELLDAACKLKMIQVPGAGIDAVDLKILEGRGIPLCNSKSNAPFVAEHALSLLLSIIKKIPLHDREARAGRWFRPSGNKSDLVFQSDTLYKKSVGFLGFGDVGNNIARLLGPFDVRIKAFVKNGGKMRRGEANVAFSGLDEVMKDSDILFVTLPLTAETKGMISKDKISLMKNNAYIVNVSRGQVIDEGALYDALKNNRIAGAAIDVWSGNHSVDGTKRYPSKDYPFHELNNVVISPYRAGYIGDESPHLWGAVKNLHEFASSGVISNKVDVMKGY